MRHSSWTLLAPLAAGSLLLAACGGAATTPTAPKTETKATAPTAPKSETDAKAETKTDAKADAKAAGTGKATGEPLKIGQLCDRSGPTVNIGAKLCDGFQNWIEVANNSLGGVKGRPVQALEVDHKYEVPLGVDAYKRLVTRDNVPEILCYGTPIVDALAPSGNQDKIVLWTPGFGLSTAADGKQFPYIFIGVATYYAQAMALMDYVAQDWKQQGKTGNAKFIFMHTDNPFGRDPLEVIKNESKTLGLDLVDTVAVPANAVDMTTIMATAKDKNPDYIVTQLGGKLPALSIQGAEKVGFPRDKMITMVWGFSEDEVDVAKQAAEKYRGLQFTALLSDNPEAYQLLDKYWKDSGQQPNPKRTSVYYARGVMSADIMLEALRLADDPTKGESVKKGAESIREFSAHGMISGTTLSSDDHGGSRKVRMYEVQNGELKRIKDWFEGPMPKGA